MLASFSWWEIGLASVILLLAGGEYLALRQARSQGLTQNVSRLFSHAFLAALALGFIVLTLLWVRAVESPELPRQAPVANWSYLLLAAMIGVVACYEVLALHRARRQGLTRNRSRLVTHLAMLLLLLVLVGINLSKWDLYLQRLQQTYEESLVGGRGAGG